MNTEQRSKNIFTYIKTHYGETKRPDDGRSISQNVAHLNILVHDMINLLYYEYWTDKQKYLYEYRIILASVLGRKNFRYMSEQPEFPYQQE